MTRRPTPETMSQIREWLQWRPSGVDTEQLRMAFLWASILAEPLGRTPGRQGSPVGLIESGRPPPDGFYDPEKLQELADHAKAGDATADGLLCFIAAGYVRHGLAVPGGPLREYITRKLDGAFAGEPWPKTRRGRTAHSNFNRDFPIVIVVARLVRDGFKATRSENSQGRLSACAIVAEALEGTGERLSEAAIAKIWQQYRHVAQSLLPSQSVGKNSGEFRRLN